MTQSEALVTRQESQALAYRHELTVEEILAQADKIKQAMTKAMDEGVHYGTIPGTPKPTLYKAGAEKLILIFRLDPQYNSTETYSGDHLHVKSVCTLWHIPTGQRFGSGEGSCSTREAKYAWRFTKRACPSCKAEAIGKSKAEYGGGWYCNRKAGGCGAAFKPHSDGAKAVEAQREVGKVPNPDVADQYNTVLKMANKRALVAAVLNVTAASDVFTQDVEDEEDDGDTGRREQPVGRPDPAEESRRGEEQSREAGGDQPITPEQLTRFHAIAGQQKWSPEQVHTLLSGYQLNSSKDIPMRLYNTLVDKHLKVGPEKGLKTQQGTLA